MKDEFDIYGNVEFPLVPNVTIKKTKYQPIIRPHEYFFDADDYYPEVESFHYERGDAD